MAKVKTFSSEPRFHVHDQLEVLDKAFVGNAVTCLRDLDGRELATGVIRATAKQTHHFYVCG
jgi:hypothetical protein